MTYSQKLRSPLWQKKRLEILQRDQWRCQACGSETKNLQVHHLVYAKRDPWDYADACYQTLCDECHEMRQELADKSANALKLLLKNVPTHKMESVAIALINRATEIDSHLVAKAWPALEVGQERFFGYVVGMGVVEESSDEEKPECYVDFSSSASGRERFLLPDNEDLRSQLLFYLTGNVNPNCGGGIYCKVWVKRVSEDKYEVTLP